MSDYFKILQDYCKTLPSIQSHPCNCIGPQNDQPACPCAMRDVKVVDGRWVRTEDLGPVKS